MDLNGKHYSSRFNPLFSAVCVECEKGEKVAPLPSKQTEASPRRHTPKNVSAEVMLNESDVRGYTVCTGLSGCCDTTMSDLLPNQKYDAT